MNHIAEAATHDDSLSTAPRQQAGLPPDNPLVSQTEVGTMKADAAGASAPGVRPAARTLIDGRSEPATSRDLTRFELFQVRSQVVEEVGISIRKNAKKGTAPVFRVLLPPGRWLPAEDLLMAGHRWAAEILGRPAEEGIVLFLTEFKESIVLQGAVRTFASPRTMKRAWRATGGAGAVIICATKKNRRLVVPRLFHAMRDLPNLHLPYSERVIFMGKEWEHIFDQYGMKATSADFDFRPFLHPAALEAPAAPPRPSSTSPATPNSPPAPASPVAKAPRKCHDCDVRDVRKGRGRCTRCEACWEKWNAKRSGGRPGISEPEPEPEPADAESASADAQGRQVNISRARRSRRGRTNLKRKLAARE